MRSCLATPYTLRWACLLAARAQLCHPQQSQNGSSVHLTWPRHTGHILCAGITLHMEFALQYQGAQGCIFFLHWGICLCEPHFHARHWAFCPGLRQVQQLTVFSLSQLTAMHEVCAKWEQSVWEAKGKGWSSSPLFSGQLVYVSRETAPSVNRFQFLNSFSFRL